MNRFKTKTGVPTGQFSLLYLASEQDGVASGEIKVAIGSGNQGQASRATPYFFYFLTNLITFNISSALQKKLLLRDTRTLAISLLRVRLESGARQWL